MTVRIVSKGATVRRPFFRRRKSCPFSGPNAPKIDFKDVKLLQRFVSERGKMPSPLPRLTMMLPPSTRWTMPFTISPTRSRYWSHRLRK